MREIVTLQLGNLSNYVATHFWNAQESYFTYSDDEKPLVNHDVHWRAGIGHDGAETFLPRTVVYDLKGGFGSLRKINALYDASENAASPSLWHGQPTVQKETPVEPSAYQQSLDAEIMPPQLTSSTVRYWSDFSRVFFHPKSLVQLYDYELSSTISPFERFSMGIELFGSLDKEHDIIDRDWRPFLEECDQVQGFQIYTTLDDAWGGFASSYLEALRDEYPKTCFWVWGSQAPVRGIPKEKHQMRLANTAQTLSEICSTASLVLPLSVPGHSLPPRVQVDTGSSWHVSALLAAAAESASLPSRLHGTSKQGVSSLDEMTEGLNSSGDRSLAEARISVGPKADTCDYDQLDIDLSGIGSSTASTETREVTYFGRLSLRRGLSPTQTGSEGQEDECTARKHQEDPALLSYATPLKFPLPNSFPTDLFPGAKGQSSISTYTTLTTDKSIAAKIKMLRLQATRLVGLESRESLSSKLADISDAYRDDWSSGSDTDEDDM